MESKGVGCHLYGKTAAVEANACYSTCIQFDFTHALCGLSFSYLCSFLSSSSSSIHPLARPLARPLACPYYTHHHGDADHSICT